MPIRFIPSIPRPPIVLALAACLPLAAGAQSAPPAAPVAPVAPVSAQPAKPVESSTVPSVTIAAERPTSRIDRQVYDVKSDPGTTNNSAADALSNVPSVAVDPDGTVSLRGSTNVQILVDGKPSAMLQGDNRGAALNSLPSDDIESIEVINNPGAQFGNEGSGGPILNLVMRRNRRPGGMGAVNLNAGVKGRYNGGVSGNFNTGRLTLQGGVNLRHDGRDEAGSSWRERIDPASGAVSRSEQTNSARGLNDSVGLNGGIGYNIGDKDRISASVSYNKRSNDRVNENRYLSYGRDAALASDLLSQGESGGDNTSYAGSVTYDHKGDADGENFKLDLRVSSSDNEAETRQNNRYLFSDRAQRDTRTRRRNDGGNRIVDLTGDYELPIERNLLKLGFKLAENEGSFDTLYANVDPASGTESLDPTRSNAFGVTERNLALYGSYHLRLNERWGLLPGLRAEYTDIDIDQRTAATQAHNSYMSWIPSLFLNYKASDKSTIRLQYAKRIRRPNVNDLNPFVVYRDEFNVSSGNPALAPVKIDSLELLLDSAIGSWDTNLRAFARRESDLITERRYFINETVLLTTRENAGVNRSAGVEFQVNGKLLPNLSLNTSGTLLRAEQQNFRVLGAASKQSATALSLRAMLRYQPTAADNMRLTLNRQGRALQGDGYRKAVSTANFSWQHRLSQRLSLALNITDLFDSNKMESIVDTDVLRSSSVRQFDGRIVYAGISYSFGGVSGSPQRRSGEGGRMGGPGGGRPGGPGGGAPMGDGGPGSRF